MFIQKRTTPFVAFHGSTSTEYLYNDKCPMPAYMRERERAPPDKASICVRAIDRDDRRKPNTDWLQYYTVE